MALSIDREYRKNWGGMNRGVSLKPPAPLPIDNGTRRRLATFVAADFYPTWPRACVNQGEMYEWTAASGRVWVMRRRFLCARHVAEGTGGF